MMPGSVPRASHRRLQKALARTCIALIMTGLCTVTSFFSDDLPAFAATTSITGSCAATNTVAVSLSPGDTLSIAKGDCVQGKVSFSSPSVTGQFTGVNLTPYGYSNLGATTIFTTTTSGTYTVWLRKGSGQPVQSVVISVAAAATPFTTTSAPTLSGTAEVGQTLSASAPSWNPTPTAFNYQWFASGSAISGATQQNFTIQPEHIGMTISVKVTGSLSGYQTTTTESTPSTSVSAIPFATTAAPTITGTPIVGNTLTASISGWSPNPTTLSYTWLADGQAIAGATSGTLSLETTHRNVTISVRVVGSAQGYLNATTTSASTSAVSLPTALSAAYHANSNEATGAPPTDPLRYTMLDSVTTLPAGALARPGYSFESWNTASNGTGTRVQPGATLAMGSTNLNLFAQWVANTHAVRFEVNGATTGQSASFLTGSAFVLPEPPASTPADTGKRFVGWYRDASLTQVAGAPGASYAPGSIGDLTLYGGWASYNLNFSTVVAPANCRVASIAFQWGLSLRLPDKPAACESMRIEGWYSDPSLTQRIGSPGQMYTPTGGSSDISLYAKTVSRFVTWWITTSYPPSNGTWHEIGESVTLPTPPSYPNKTFVWWRNNTAANTAGAPPGDYSVSSDFQQSTQGAVTLEAKYRSWLRFDLNGGSSGPVDTSVVASSYEAPVVSIDQAEPIRNGYRFSHWADQNGIARSGAMNLYGNTTLSAVWIANINIVTYDSQGGSSVASDSFATGGSLTVAQDPSRFGYTFLGWYDSPSSHLRRSGTYNPNETSDFSLYARWVKNAPPVQRQDVTTVRLDLALELGARISDGVVLAKAEGLLDSAAYSLVLRSTPRVLASGFVVGGLLNLDVEIPSDVAPGWHSLTFSSTGIDGNAIEKVLYFEVSATGVLVALSNAPYVALAQSGVWEGPVVLVALTMLVIGGGAVMHSHRRNRVTVDASEGSIPRLPLLGEDLTEPTSFQSR